jgi:hypothetical protein
MDPRRHPFLSAALLTVGLLLLAAIPAAGIARAAIGIERVEPGAGAPGDQVELTLACGFCFPPCEGPPGHRNAPCMLGTRAQPPKYFPVAIVPIEDAPPRPGLFRLAASATRLGRAKPPPDIESIRESGHGYVPRYLLDFELPGLRSGAYALVILCDACLPGRARAVISFPRDPGWRFRVHPPIASLSPVFRSDFA